MTVTRKMRSLPDKYEKYRVAHWSDSTDFGDKTNGCLRFVPGPNGRKLIIIFSNEGDWDHVSISLPDRCPTWEEMCFVKEIFFDPEDAVMQLHPPKSDYKNLHPYCLHLWRPQKEKIPLPNSLFVAP